MKRNPNVKERKQFNWLKQKRACKTMKCNTESNV